MARSDRSYTWLSLALAALLYSAVLAGILMWLWANGEDTLRERLAATPQVTVALFDTPVSVVDPVTGSQAQSPMPEDDAVPSSWQGDVQEYAQDDTQQIVQDTAQDTARVTHDKPGETGAAATGSQVPELPEMQAVQTLPQETPEPARPAVEYNPLHEALPVAMPLWKRHARPFEGADTRPRVVLVIADLGLARNAADAAIQNLPGAVTLGFSALTPDVQNWIDKARAAGHEVVLSVPMEPVNYPQNDPGPNALLLTLDDQENSARLQRILARASGYVGIMPFMGEKFVTSEEKMQPVMQILHQQGALVLDATASSSSVIAPLARLGHMAFAQADLYVDAAASGPSVDERLAELEKIAREKGVAIGVARPYPVTLERLAAWSASLDEKGLTLAPLSAAVTSSTPPMPVE